MRNKFAKTRAVSSSERSLLFLTKYAGEQPWALTERRRCRTRPGTGPFLSTQPYQRIPRLIVSGVAGCPRPRVGGQPVLSRACMNSRCVRLSRAIARTAQTSARVFHGMR